MEFTLTAFFAAMVVMAAPLILAALGETLTERAGVVNLSLDGTILLGAMAGFATASFSGSTLLGFAAAGISGSLVAAVLAITGIWLRQSQVATGFALTFLCRDLAYFLGTPYGRQQGPQLDTLPIPLLADLPFIGPVLFSHSLVIYASIVALPLFAWLLFRTGYGLALRTAGENPAACWARGYNPIRLQIEATLAGGFLVGVAGAAYSLSVKPGWGHPQGCEGIGWVCLALVIFGSWNPFRVVLGAYFFALLQLLGIHFQNAFPAIPAQIFQVAPFPLMIFTLVFIHLVQKGSHRKGAFRWLTALFQDRPPLWLGKNFHQQ